MSEIVRYQRVCGVDVAKETLQIHLLGEDLDLSLGLPNTPAGHARIVELCRQHQIQIVLSEATGGLQRPLCLALAQGRLALAVINPSRIRHYALSEGIMAKTDQVDARIIACFALKIAPKPTVLRDQQQEQLARLAARKAQLTDLKVQEQNRLQQEPEALALASIRRLLEFVGQEIDQLDQMLEQLVTQDELLAAKVQAADSLLGVGRASAIALLVNMPELGSIGNKQAAALAGLAPYNRESGKIVGDRHIYGGRVAVRGTLYMCALTAVRYEGKIKSFYQSLLQAGKCKMMALTACMHKMLVIINARIRDAMLAAKASTKGQGGGAIAAGG